MEQTLELALLIGLLVAAYLWHRQCLNDGSWHEHTSLQRGTVMRRRLKDGTWQYRDLSSEEEIDRQGHQV